MNADERKAMRGQAEEHPPYLTISPDKLLGLLDALDAAEQRAELYKQDAHKLDVVLAENRAYLAEAVRLLNGWVRGRRRQLHEETDEFLFSTPSDSLA